MNHCTDIHGSIFFLNIPVVCELGGKKTKLVAGMATFTGKPSWARDLRPVGLNYNFWRDCDKH